MRIRPVRIYNHFPLEFGGGGEASLSLLATKLSGAGFNVEYVTDSDYGGVTRLTSQQTAELSSRFRYVRERFQDYAKPGMKFLFRRLPCVSELSRDAIHLLVIDRVPPASFLAQARDRGVRLGILMHGLSPCDSPVGQPVAAAYQFYVRRALRKLISSGLLNWCYVQVFNRATLEFLAKSGMPEQNIFEIPTGVQMSRYGPPTSDGKFNVLFMGRLDRLTKGIDTLSEVIKHFVERHSGDLIRVRIVGSGRDSRSLDKVRGLRSVTIDGFIPEEEKFAALAASQVLLITSRMEPFSMVAVEALASGAFVISTPVAGPMGIISRDPSFGAISGPDAGSLVNILNSTFEAWRVDCHLFDRMRLGRAAVAAQHFNIETMVQKYSVMIEQLGSGLTV